MPRAWKCDQRRIGIIELKVRITRRKPDRPDVQQRAQAGERPAGIVAICRLYADAAVTEHAERADAACNAYGTAQPTARSWHVPAREPVAAKLSRSQMPDVEQRDVRR